MTMRPDIARSSVVLAALLALPLLAMAASPVPQPLDFRAGLQLEATAGRPVQVLTVPDAVYAGTTLDDLGDVAIFNASGIAVPFAWCPATRPMAEVVQQPLPVFELRAGQRTPGTARTRIETTTQGTVNVQVDPTTTVASAPAPAGFVIDARKRRGPLQALQLAWTAADGASSLQVRVEASDDLDHWITRVDETTLLQVDAGDGDGANVAVVPPPAASNPAAAEAAYAKDDNDTAPRRIRIELSPTDAAYLRLTRVDAGPPPVLRGVVADVALPAATVPLRSVPAVALPSAEVGAFVFDSGRRAPMQQAQVQLPAANMRARIVLESRADPSKPWGPRWQGEIYALQAGNTLRQSAPIPLEDVGDRYWRVRVESGAESLGDAPLQLTLAYAPAQLQFLAQGQGPFQLAFGSGRSDSHPAACDALASDLAAGDRNAMTGTARIGELIALGGDAALAARPEPPKRRPLLLWGILIVGVGLLLVMSLSLLSSARKPLP